MDAQAGRNLRRLFERRARADDDLAPVPRALAEEMSDDALRVVERVEEWLR